MELKLVDEIRSSKMSPVREESRPFKGNGSPNPQSMLISELFESVKAKGSQSKLAFPEKVALAEPATTEINFKANLRKVPKSTSDDKEKEIQIDFKSQLKKKPSPSLNSDESLPHLVDFKSKLRKSRPETSPISSPEHPIDYKSRLRKVTKPESDEEEKRRSTGSITSSLRKMWESSPRKPSDGEVETSTGIVKYEKRIWPPVPNTEMEKPMVPVKPTVKPLAPPTTKPPPPKQSSPILGIKLSSSKPAMLVKPNVCNIYASLSVVQPKLKETEDLLEATRMLEKQLDAAKRDTSTLSKEELSHLSDQIGLFHENCADLSDLVAPTMR